jgi:hypothetical protein
MCTVVVKGTLLYYIHNNSSVSCMFLDATKAFDMVNQWLNGWTSRSLDWTLTSRLWNPLIVTDKPLKALNQALSGSL